MLLLCGRSEPLRKPVKVAVETEDAVPGSARARKFMVFVGEAHKLGWHTTPLERHIELLALFDSTAVVEGRMDH